MLVTTHEGFQKLKIVSRSLMSQETTDYYQRIFSGVLSLEQVNSGVERLSRTLETITPSPPQRYSKNLWECIQVDILITLTWEYNFLNPRKQRDETNSRGTNEPPLHWTDKPDIQRELTFLRWIASVGRKRWADNRARIRFHARYWIMKRNMILNNYFLRTANLRTNFRLSPSWCPLL